MLSFTKTIIFPVFSIHLKATKCSFGYLLLALCPDFRFFYCICSKSNSFETKLCFLLPSCTQAPGIAWQSPLEPHLCSKTEIFKSLEAIVKLYLSGLWLFFSFYFQCKCDFSKYSTKTREVFSYICSRMAKYQGSHLGNQVSWYWSAIFWRGFDLTLSRKWPLVCSDLQ